MKSLVIYHRKRGSVHGCAIDSPEARKRLETALRCIKNDDVNYVLCELDGDWRDYGYEELADACRRQCKPESENQLDDKKIYIVVPRGTQVLNPFDKAKGREATIFPNKSAMMMPGSIHEGDFVETMDVRVGYIKDICRCEKCAERGFYEPTVHFTDGEEDAITKYEAENGFKGYKRIGRWLNADEAQEAQKPKEIEFLPESWMDTPEKRKINELVAAVNELRKGRT